MSWLLRIHDEPAGETPAESGPTLYLESQAPEAPGRPVSSAVDSLWVETLFKFHPPAVPPRIVPRNDSSVGKYPFWVNEHDRFFSLDQILGLWTMALDGHLTPEQQADATGLESLLGDLQMYMSYYEDKTGVDWPVSVFLGRRARNDVATWASAKTGDPFSEAAALDAITRGLTLVSDMLGAQDFLFGTRPTSVDAHLFAILHLTLAQASPLSAAFKLDMSRALPPNLAAFSRAVWKTHFAQDSKPS